MTYITKQHERSLVLLKPDAVQRGLVGEIISRFEKKGLKIIGMKMVWTNYAQANKHYHAPKSDMIASGERTLKSYKEKGLKHRFSDPIDIFKDIQTRLAKYLTAGPIVALVLEGAHAIEHVRKVRGHTNPLDADVGTITADLTIDSYFVSDDDQRSIRNLVHASGSSKEAQREIGLWFSSKELHRYNLAIEEILYSRDWGTKLGKLIKKTEN